MAPCIWFLSSHPCSARESWVCTRLCISLFKRAFALILPCHYPVWAQPYSLETHVSYTESPWNSQSSLLVLSDSVSVWMQSVGKHGVTVVRDLCWDTICALWFGLSDCKTMTFISGCFILTVKFRNRIVTGEKAGTPGSDQASFQILKDLLEKKHSLLNGQMQAIWPRSC